MIKSACAYIRVSTDDQVEFSPESQRKLIIEYCQKNGYIINNADIYEDLGISGRTVEKRPAFNRMIAMAKSKAHPYDAIIVWKFSRFARNQEESIVYKSMLRKIGVEVISISEPISEGLGGKLTEAILEIMDEYYSINLSQEVMRGMKESALQGKRMSVAPYGYKLKNKKLVIEPSEAEVVKYMFESMTQKTTKLQTLAFDINRKNIFTKSGKRWETRSIKYLLQNPVYIGKARWNYATHAGKKGTTKINDESQWIIVDSDHEPIISPEIFDEVQLKLKLSKKPQANRRIAQKHYLSGILKCGYCGGGMAFHCGDERNSTPPYFICQQYNRGRCDYRNSKNAAFMESEFLRNFEENVRNLDMNLHDIKVELPYDPQIDELNKQLESNRKKLNRVKQAYLDGVDSIDEYKTNKDLLNQEYNDICLTLDKLKSEEAQVKEIDFEAEINHVLNVLKSDNYSMQEKQATLSQVLDKVIYKKDDNTWDFYLRL